MPKHSETVWYDALNGEPTLKLCSEGAQLLWIHMFLYTACESPEYGLLLNGNGTIPTADELSRIFSRPRARVLKLISELEKHGVFSRHESGAIMCRRQRKRVELSEKRAKAAKTRWEIVEQSVENLQCKTDANADANAYANARYRLDPRSNDPLISKERLSRRRRRDTDPELKSRAEMVIALWNEITKNTLLPDAPPFGALKQRDKNLLARLDKQSHRDEQWWRMVFEWIAKTPRENGQLGTWKTQLVWLVKTEDTLREKFEEAKKARTVAIGPPRKPEDRGSLPLVIPEKPAPAEIPAGGIPRLRE